MGDLLELRRRHVRMLADAEQRGDLFTIVQLRATVSSVLSLAADDPETARRLGREALSNWTQSKFVAQHWQVMRSEVEIALYEGDGKAAYERFQQDARALKKSFLLPGHQYLRAMSAFVRGRAAIASAGAVPERRAARLAEARRLARRLEQERMVWTAPLAAILTAGVAKVQGDRAGATASLRAAVELAQAADMSLYATAARHELGLVLGGQEGAEIVARAQDDMKAQEIVAPARFAAMLVPGRWTPS
jgi:ATP/maltotriose-dependent transcriptional regulator MalT